MFTETSSFPTKFKSSLSMSLEVDTAADSDDVCADVDGGLVDTFLDEADADFSLSFIKGDILLQRNART